MVRGIGLAEREEEEEEGAHLILWRTHEVGISFKKKSILLFKGVFPCNLCVHVHVEVARFHEVLTGKFRVGFLNKGQAESRNSQLTLAVMSMRFKCISAFLDT